MLAALFAVVSRADLVTPPTDVEPETYYTTGGTFYVSGSSGWVDATSQMPTIQVIIKGTDIYIQGLAYYFEEGWIKGVLFGSTATFSSGQLVGTDQYGDEYLVGSNDGSTVSSIAFTLDKDAGTLTAVTQLIVESGAPDALNPYAYWVQPEFSKTASEIPQQVEAPNDLETADYTFSGIMGGDTEASSLALKIGFKDNDVYVQGLCSYLPNAWIKGTLDGTTITFPTGQYFGAISGTQLWFLGFGAAGVKDMTFTYDAATGTMTSTDYYLMNKKKNDLGDQYANVVRIYSNITITKVQEKAATPANPTIISIADTKWGDVINFTIPLTDVNGEGLLAGKLYYQLWSEEGGVQSPVTFTTTDFQYLTENMTEVPYGFQDQEGGYDFLGSSIYLNMAHDTWTRIGLQSIYYGGGETHKSDIVWYNLSSTDGISQVKNDTTQKNAIYNMAGQRVEKASKGLYIVNGRKVVMK